MADSVVFERSKLFATRIINLYKYLVSEKKEYILSDQIFRSGTSIGANIAEGRYAQTKADFIAKYSIAVKECSETMYWIDLLYDNSYINQQEYESIKTDAEEILKLLIASIKTAKKKLELEKRNK